MIALSAEWKQVPVHYLFLTRLSIQNGADTAIYTHIKQSIRTPSPNVSSDSVRRAAHMRLTCDEHIIC